MCFAYVLSSGTNEKLYKYSSKGELTECLSNCIYDEINIEHKLTEYIASHITG